MYLHILNQDTMLIAMSTSMILPYVLYEQWYKGMLNMYEVKDKNKTYLFSNKTDADNYIDYLQHGLKCIAKKRQNLLF